MIGSIWASAMAGYLAEHGFSGGWPSTFYVSGVIALASAAAWTPCVTSNPEVNSLRHEILRVLINCAHHQDHWSISVTEMKHIRRQSGVPDASGESSAGTRRRVKKRGRKVPWSAILTNRAVLANIFSKFFLRWTFYTLIMKLPTYLVRILTLKSTANNLSLCSERRTSHESYESKYLLFYEPMTDTHADISAERSSERDHVLDQHVSHAVRRLLV